MITCTQNLGSIPDSDLVHLARNKNEDATRELFNRYNRNLVAYLLKARGRPADAGDSAAEAFWDALRCFDAGRGSFAPLLYKIARRKHTRTSFVDRVIDRFCVSRQPEFFSHSTVVEDLELHQCVERLKPIYRDVVELAYFGGLMDAEAAEVLDVPVGTVQSRKHEAIRQLREMMNVEVSKRPKR